MSRRGLLLCLVLSGSAGIALAQDDGRGAKGGSARPLPTRLELRYPPGQQLTWHMALAYRARAEAHESFRMDQRADVRETVLPSAEKDAIRVRWERLGFAVRFYDGRHTWTYEDQGKDAAEHKADFLQIATLVPFERSYEYELARNTLEGGKVERFAWIHDARPANAGAWAESVRLQQQRGAQRFQNRPLDKGASWSVDEEDEDLRGGWTLKRQTTYTVAGRDVFDGRACIRLETSQTGRVEGHGDLPCELETCSARGEVLFDLELGNVSREGLRTDVVLRRQGGSPIHAFEDERTLDFRLVLLPRPDANTGPRAPTKTPRGDDDGE